MGHLCSQQPSAARGPWWGFGPAASVATAPLGLTARQFAGVHAKKFPLNDCRARESLLSPPAGITPPTYTHQRFCIQNLPKMAFKSLGRATGIKRKAGSNEKSNGDNRTKKARVVPAPKHHEVKEAESAASDGSDDELPDSGYGGAPLASNGRLSENAPKSAGPKSNGAGQVKNTVERGLSTILTLLVECPNTLQLKTPESRMRNKSSSRRSARRRNPWRMKCTGQRSCGRSCAASPTCPRRSASNLSTSFTV